LACVAKSVDRGRDDEAMTPYADQSWSPADNPYAIAVSEGWWWRRAVNLCVHRIQEGDDPNRQVDARLLILALSLLEQAAAMEAAAIDEEAQAAVWSQLEQARTRFNQLVPGLRDARNVLSHFDEYARGQGRLQQDYRDHAAAARCYSVGGYDPENGKVVVGPHQIDVNQARAQAHELFTALYAAARAVDPSRDVR
jgi:hypothetical protein